MRADLAAWVAHTEAARVLFKRYVYENPEAQQTDFRQHRAALLDLMAKGEILALEFLRHHEEEAPDAITHLDGLLAGLSREYFDWHGPLEAQSDVPESFKQAAREVSEGKTASFDEALLGAD